MQTLFAVLCAVITAGAMHVQAGSENTGQERSTPAVSPDTPAQTSKQPIRTPLRVSTTTSNAAASGSRAASAPSVSTTAAEREAQSLIFQERSAIAAEEQALLARWSIIISALGAMLLIWNIAQTRKATTAASEAAAAATEQVRAVVKMERASLIVTDVALRPIRVTAKEDTLYLPVVTYVNHGRSAAMVTKAGIQTMICSESELPVTPQYQQTVDCDPSSIGSLFIKPGETYIDQALGMLSVSEPQQKSLGGTDGRFIWVWGHIEFLDQFDGVTDAGFIAFQYPEVRAGDKVLQPAGFRFKGPSVYTYVRHRTYSETEA